MEERKMFKPKAIYFEKEIINYQYTSSGCTAACMYCYLVCNYNKCAYLRLFVNREQMKKYFPNNKIEYIV